MRKQMNDLEKMWDTLQSGKLDAFADILYGDLYIKSSHEQQDMPKREPYSNIEPNTGLRRHGEI